MVWDESTTPLSAANLNALETRIADAVTAVSDAKTPIAAAITAMGQASTSADTFAQMATKIQDISDDANAAVGDVLLNKTFYQGGSKKTGTISSKSAATYTPGTTDQTIAAVQYLSGAQTIKGDANLVAAKIPAEYTMFGIAGAYSCIKSVQRGQIVITAGDTVEDITITSVDTTKCAIIIAQPSTGSGGIYGSGYFGATLSSATNLRLTVQSAYGATYDWQVIEFDNVKSVQSGVVSSGNSVAITAVNLAKTILFYHNRTFDGSPTGGQAYLTNSTTLTTYGFSSYQYTYYSIVEFN